MHRAESNEPPTANSDMKAADIQQETFTRIHENIAPIKRMLGMEIQSVAKKGLLTLESKVSYPSPAPVGHLVAEGVAG